MHTITTTPEAAAIIDSHPLGPVARAAAKALVDERRQVLIEVHNATFRVTARIRGMGVVAMAMPSAALPEGVVTLFDGEHHSHRVGFYPVDHIAEIITARNRALAHRLASMWDRLLPAAA